MQNSANARQLTLLHEPDAVVFARERAGLSQAEAAKLIGKSPQLLNDIEKGRRNATPAVLRAMASAYNCPLVVLERKRWSA